MEPRPLYVVAFGAGVTIALLLLLRVGQRLFSPKPTVSADLTAGSSARLLQVGQVLAVFLKSDYGAEGAEVILDRNVTDEVWAASIRHARPGRWIAQRWFRADVDDVGETVNYGVFLVAGEASGIYARVQAGATETAISAPTLIV